jgi:probable HAF family extracellular repeat protein
MKTLTVGAIPTAVASSSVTDKFRMIVKSASGVLLCMSLIILQHPGLARNNPTFTVTDLRIPGIGNCASINNSGRIAACFFSDDSMLHSVLWDKGEQTSLSDLSIAGSPSINDKGEIAGSVAQPEVPGYGIPYIAFLWAKGTLKEIGAFPSAIPISVAQGINNRTQIVGNSATFVIGQAFLWQNNQLRNLGTLPAPMPQNSFSAANAINDNGQIVGKSDSSSGYRHAVFWQRNGTIVDLGLPPGLTVGNTDARSINERGQIVGDYQSGTGEPGSVLALLWDAGTISNLGVARPDDIYSIALGINNRGEIIGLSESSEDSTGWFWNGVIHNLDDLIDQRDPLKPYLHVTDALSINNRTQIVVLGHDTRIGPCVFRSCPVYLYLLTPSR